MATEQVETAIYRLRVEGEEEIDRLTKSIGDLTVAEEKATTQNRTTSEELQKRLARYDPLIRAQQAYSKELQQIARYQETGVGTQQQINALFEGATARYQAAQKAAQGLGEAHKGLSSQGQAAFHSLRSVAEQVALGVPITQALTGQMNHLAYVMSGEGGIVGAFKEVGGFLTGFLTPARLAVGAIGAIGAAAAAAAVQWANAQKQMEQSLLGIGARSGATVSSINAFARGGGLTGLSVGERREAAGEFVKTGDIDPSKIKGLTEAIEGYSIITGKTAVDASKALAQALSGDLSKGIADLGKVYGTLNPVLQQTVDTYLRLGETEKAQQAIIAALAAENERAIKTLSPLAIGWIAVGNAISIAADAAMRFLQYRVTAAGRAQQARQQSEAEAAGMGMRDDLVAAKGQAAVESVEPQIAQIRKLEQALVDLQRAKTGVGETGPIPPIVDQGAEQIIRNSLQLLKESKEEAVRYSQQVAEIAARWGNVGQAVALQLQQLQNELPVLQAITGQQRMAAQAAADYANAINAGKTELEASALAAAKLEAAQAAATTAVKQQVEQLKDSTAMIKAQQNGTEATTAASIAYKNAIESGASYTSAAALAAATLENRMASAAGQTRQMAQAAADAEVAMENTARNAKTAEDLARAMRSAFEPVTMPTGALSFEAGGSVSYRGGGTGKRLDFGYGEIGNALLAQGQATVDPISGLLKGIPPEANKVDDLKTSIDDLKTSTDDLRKSNEDLLSPYYTLDPRTSHIGFRSQGMSLGGYVDVPGGMSSNDNMIATIPVASGERIYIDPTANRRSAGSGNGSGMVVNISSPIAIYGNPNKDEFGRTLYQNNQTLAKQVRAATQ